MFHKTLSQVVPVFLSLSLGSLPASHASAQELAVPALTSFIGLSASCVGLSSAFAAPLAGGGAAVLWVSWDSVACSAVETSADEEKSVTPETAAEPEEDDPAVDFYENIFKIKSVTGGGVGPAGFLKGAKTESQDHRSLIASSEKRQKNATQPQPIAAQEGGPATAPAEQLGKGGATGNICLRVPLSKKAPEAATDETREKTEKVEPKSGEGTESSPPPDNL
ncbi:MAG TPA: hypothetical protein VF173_20405 [Thermoanaerobaculia bacterium]|nr:hypothetical protein [Thermoanaerobaculia bacterium]